MARRKNKSFWDGKEIDIDDDMKRRREEEDYVYSSDSPREERY